jgi:4'-phosphopantetheinyl transferase
MAGQARRVDRVDVLAARLEPVADDACSSDEHDRAGRFRDPLSGARWLAARHLVRTLLGEALGVGPAAVEFTPGPHGKPAVPGIEFNLSHAGAIAVVAVSPRPVGVDVEVPRRIVNPRGVARRLGLPADTPPDVLLRAWTRTEALLKATGDGASAGLAGVEQRLGSAGWVVHDLDLGAPALGAVAAVGVDWVVAGPRWVTLG